LFRHHLPRGKDGVSPDVPDWPGDPNGSDFDALLQSTMRMLHRHRITPVLHELAPIVKVDARGEIAVDWGLYDSIVEPYLSGRAFLNRVPAAVWPMPLQPLLSDRLRGAELSSPRYDRLVQQYLNACAEHFIERGWLQRSYAMVPLDDTTLRMDRSGHGPYAHGHGQERADRVAARVQTFASAVRQADDRMRVLLRWFPQDLSPYGWVDYAVPDLQDQVDIWAPPAQFFDVDAMRGQRAEGRQTWLGVDRPPFSGSISIYAPPTFVRVLAWQARQLGADALDLGRINRWPDGRGAAEPVDCIRADPNVLLYPGAAFGLNEPVASVRLKQLRRSMQDAAYLRLLSEHGLEHIGKTVQESLAPYAGSSAYRTHFADGRPIGWVDDPMLFETARRVMAQELMKAAGKAPAPSRSATLRRTTAWRRLMSETRKLHLVADGCRVRWSSFRGDGAAEVECSMTLVNRTRVPVRGTIRFADLPAGWSMPNERTHVPSIAPNESRRVVVTADAMRLPTGTDGCFSLPVVFEAEDGSQHRRDARICCLIAGRTGEEIVIDGDLSDWPPGVTNVARGFRWIAEGDRNSLSQRVWHGFVTRTFHRLKTGATRVTGIGPNINDRRATYAPADTLSLVMVDDRYLYVAVNCVTGETGIGSASRANTVVHDDLVPVGDERIEVLIDPLNAGTRSPSDLFYITVKPSGAATWGKGIASDPPCGRHEPWPVDLKVATRSMRNRWTVELRIPLSAFGPAAFDNAIWGFNITRWDAARQEFSTWSGAQGNAYDPLSLGNLAFPVLDSR
ncbi:MAG: DUF4091 domain-containing protein, partial [Planctomycetes bacterium]|nr:DUF4091 domain-containing protein [Planctomycetota bacterium]